MYKFETNENTVGLDTIVLIMWAEKQYGIEIPDEEIRGILTVGQFCQCIADRAAAKAGAHAPCYEAIFEQVANCLVSKNRVSPEQVVEHARFLEDLGLD